MHQLHRVLALIILCNTVTAQSLQWAGQLGGTGFESGESVVADERGNVYFTGTFTNAPDADPGPGVFTLTSAGAQDIYLCSWTAQGQFRWAFSVGAAQQDFAYSIDYRHGRLVITGRFRQTVDFDPGAGVANRTAVASYDMFVACYDTLGNYLWVDQFGNTGNNEPTHVAIDHSGNIWFDGLFGGPCDFDPGPGTFTLTSIGTQDAFVCKLDSLGNFLWAGKFGSAPGEFAYGLDHDAAGNVYLTGLFWGTVDFDPGPGVQNRTASTFTHDLFVLSLDNNGTFRWVDQIDPSAGDQTGYGLWVAGNSVLVSGTFDGTTDFNPGPSVFTITSAGADDIFILKLDLLGNFVDAAGMGSSGNDASWAVTVDLSGHVFSTGYFSNTADFDPGTGVYQLTAQGSSDVYVSELDANLDFKAAYAIGGTQGDYGRHISMTPAGHVMVSGQFAYTADFDPTAGTYNLSSVLGTTDAFVTSASFCPTVVHVDSLTFCPGDSVMIFGEWRNVPGVYADTGISSQGCDSVSQVILTYIFHFELGADKAMCPGDSVVIDAGVGGAIYSWCNGSTSQAITAFAFGCYCVTVTMNGCAQSDSVCVVPQSVPTLDLGNDTTICYGSLLPLDAGSGPASYVWSDGSTGQTLSAGEGTWWVTKSNAFNCSVSDTITVTWLQELDPGIAGDSMVCQGESVVISANSGFSTYMWSNGSSSSSLVVDSDTLLIGSNWFFITVTDEFDCPGYDTVTITVLQTPTLDSLTDVESCHGDTLVMTAPSGFMAYSWHNTELDHHYYTQQVTIITDTLPVGVYNFILSVNDSNGCSNEATIAVTVYELPVVVAPDTLVAKGSVVTISAPGGFTAYHWQIVPLGYEYQAQGFIIDTDTFQVGTYLLLLTVTDGHGCSGSDSGSLAVAWMDGLTSPEQTVITVHPNPASSHVFFQCAREFDEAIIMNALGERVLWADTARLDVGQLPAGMYRLALRLQGLAIGTCSFVVTH